MNKNKLIIGIIFIITSIILGAFTAHALKSKISSTSIGNLHTATQYLMYNGLGLISIYSLTAHNIVISNPWPSRLIIIGTIAFSGSIILLSLRSLVQIIPTSILGPITPIGGILMILGWLILLYSVLKSNKDE